MNRRKARELIFTLVYEYSFKQDSDCAEVYATALNEREFENDEFVRSSFEGIVTNLEAIDQKIEPNLNGWKLQRVSKVTLSILRVSTYEMLYRDDIDFEVSINEAVELAKQFDDEKAVKFINGVLNTIAKKEGLKG